jgi:hypothetical protein
LFTGSALIDLRPHGWMLLQETYQGDHAAEHLPTLGFRFTPGNTGFKVP